MCTQTLTNKQMTMLYQKLTWQNSREIVLYTVLSQMIIVALLTSTSATQWMQGGSSITFLFHYYDLQVPLLFACISAFWFGQHINSQRLTPFHFPKAIVRTGTYIVVATYGCMLAIALLLERYMIAAIVEWTNDDQWHLAMTNSWIDFLFVLASLYIITITGMLYKVKPVATILLYVVSIAWLLFSSLQLYKQKILDWLLSLHWSETQYEAFRLAILIGPIATMVLIMALVVLRKERM